LDDNGDFSGFDGATNFSITLPEDGILQYEPTFPKWHAV
jgi:hypothetical protein